MNFTEAAEKARAEKPEADYYVEFENAYSFFVKAEERSKGGDSPIVVPKDGTECLNILYALQETVCLDGDPIKEGFIDAR